MEKISSQLLSLELFELGQFPIIFSTLIAIREPHQVSFQPLLDSSLIPFEMVLVKLGLVKLEPVELELAELEVAL
jgi:hypothetical protein